MNAFTKAITAFLGIIAVLACVATVGIVGYSLVNGDSSQLVKGKKTDEELVASKELEDGESLANGEPNGENQGNPDGAPDGNPDGSVTPTVEPSLDEEIHEVPYALKIDPNHIHDYKEKVLKKATCLTSGRLRFECVCGDYYEVDQLSKGHLADDQWVVVTPATKKTAGQKVRKCIYCDEVVESQIIPAASNSDPNATPTPYHEHLYVATTEREPSCVLAGLRKLTCACGNFYTETIPAIGHVATDWQNAQLPTTASYGTSQRTCSVCGTVLDSKVLPPLVPSPSNSPSTTQNSQATAAPSGSTAAPTQAATASPTPSPTPHVHNYLTYVVTPATCTQKGIRSYECTLCGSDYAENIELDLNNHHFQTTYVPPTKTQQGYTIYTCTRCNYNYKDNYIMPLTNDGDDDDEVSTGDSQAQATTAPSPVAATPGSNRL